MRDRRTARLLRIATLLLLTGGPSLAFLACRPSDREPAHAVSRRDSAGVEIVVNPPTAIRWSMDAESRLVIGVADGDPDRQLFNVVGAHRFTDGRVVVASAGDHELRFFDAKGGFLSRSGGQGDGPGEFQGMNKLGVTPNDSITVWDQRHRRRSVFGPTGEPARDHRFEPPTEGAFPIYLDLFSDGSILVGISEVVEDLPSDGSVMRRPAAVLRYTTAGQPADTLGTFLGRGSYLRVYDGGASGIELFNIPFDPGTLLVPRGRGLLVASGGLNEVRQLAEDGSIVRIIRVDVPPTEVTDELRRAAIEERLQSYTNDEARDNGRVSLEAIPFPELVASYDQGLVDELGYVWVRRHALPSRSVALWRVFDAEGELVSNVEIPTDIRVWQVGVDFVLGSVTDELDVERVALYSLERTARAESAR